MQCATFTEAARLPFVSCGGWIWKHLQSQGRPPLPAHHLLPASPESSHRPTPGTLPCACLPLLPARGITSRSQALEVSLGELKAEASTLLVIHPGKGCAWVCTSGTRSTVPCQHAWHLHTGRDCTCDLEQNSCSTDSKGQGVGRKMEKLRRHLHTAQGTSHGSLVHLSCLTVSFCLFWLWEQLWFQMASAPMWVSLSVLAHVFWLVLFRFAISVVDKRKVTSWQRIFFNCWIIYLLISFDYKWPWVI